MANLCIVLFVAIAGFKTNYILSSTITKNWGYVIEDFEWNSTDENVIATPLRPLRIAPGKYGLNGTIKIRSPITNEYKIGIKIFHSPSGTSHYKLTPFQVPKYPINFYMDKFYKKFIMDDIRNCSDMPVFENKFIGPIQVRDYNLNSCVVSNDAMPTYMQIGYYKLVLEVEGPLVLFVAQLTSKIYEI